MKATTLVVVSSLLGVSSVLGMAADLPCDPIHISPATIPPAHLAPGVFYGPITLSANPIAFYTINVSEGVLPTGLALTAPYANEVELAGQAAGVGSFTFTITARNPLTGCSGGRSFSVLVFECGDWQVDSAVGEVCDDGGNIDGDGCSANCLSDETCGNDYADLSEECDGADLRGADCTTFNLINGVLACTPGTCEYDTSSCLTCGNGLIDPGEQCDSDNLQGFDCASLGLPGGTLACYPETCTFDTSGCTTFP